MSVYKKLQAARIALYNQGLKQSGKNHGGISYYELADFTVDAQRIFNEVGLCSQFNMDEQIATLSIIDVDNGSDMASFSCPVFLASIPKESERSIKNLGATITYLRRYLWMTALEIPQKEVAELVNNSKETANNSAIDARNNSITSAISKFTSLKGDDFDGMALVLVHQNPDYLHDITLECLSYIDTLDRLTGLATSLNKTPESKAVFKRIAPLFTERKTALGG